MKYVSDFEDEPRSIGSEKRGMEVRMRTEKFEELLCEIEMF